MNLKIKCRQKELTAPAPAPPRDALLDEESAEDEQEEESAEQEGEKNALLNENSAEDELEQDQESDERESEKNALLTGSSGTVSRGSPMETISCAHKKVMTQKPPCLTLLTWGATFQSRPSVVAGLCVMSAI